VIPTASGKPARRPIELIAVLAIAAVIVVYMAYGLMTASNTLGCDFLAYYNAANHWLAGQPI
jgi:hypothetical protein